MESNSFYIELSSNAKMFNENTVANFKNEINLLRPLNGAWEVAMVEMSYTKSWYTVPAQAFVGFNQDTRLYYTRNRGHGPRIEKVRIDSRMVKNYEKLMTGYYDNAMKFHNEIENKLKLVMLNANTEEKLISDPMIFFNEISKQFSIKAAKTQKNEWVFPLLSDSILRMMGFDDLTRIGNAYSAIKNTNSYVVAERPTELNRGIHTLFVYCDIIEPQFIGDTRAKLLRSVEIPNEKQFGDQVVIRYDRPHYVPVINNHFNYIEIDIKDDTDKRIPFTCGRTRIKLHFRQLNDRL